MGAPLTAQDMRFARSSSGLARALAWLTLADRAGQADAVGRVEQVVEETGYPQDRVDEAGLAAAASPPVPP